MFKLIGTKEIADCMSLSVRYVREVVVRKAWFPRPALRGRWYAEEVEQAIAKQHRKFQR